MALSQITSHCSFAQLSPKYFSFVSPLQCIRKKGMKQFWSSNDLMRVNNQSKSLVVPKTFYSTKMSGSSQLKKSSLNFETDCISHFAVTDEIQFFRDTRNNFGQMCFSDTKEPYGPPLAILLPWKTLSDSLLKKLIEFYAEKGFDIVTVNLTAQQLLYPCVSGGAMNVVTDFLQYLNEAHKHRPYIFHGFSVGAYIYGEIMAQFSDQYELYRGLTNNIKGCLWDSPVDVVAVKSCVGKFYYPKNWVRRFGTTRFTIAGPHGRRPYRWRCNAAVKRHFKSHHHDSVCYWLRSRQNFCNPLVKAPNVFFVSYTDLMSNPCTLQDLQKCLDCNGVPIYQKTWWDSGHTCHFEKYCYEYSYGLVLFLNLSNLFPDECGKYRSSSTNSSLTNLRLSKKARENICQ